MNKSQYEFVLSMQKSRFDEKLKRKPFLKIVEQTKDMPVPLLFDTRTDDEKMNWINMRIRRKRRKMSNNKLI